MDNTPSHDFTACVKALAGAFALSSKALQSELAVSLFVFHALGGATLDAKRELRAVYSDAGRPCQEHTDPAYQTVMRRIGRAAALFDKLGARRVARAVDKLTPAGAIRALVDMLAPLGLDTMDAVGVYVGQMAPSAPREPVPDGAHLAGPQGDADPEVEVIHVRTRHIDVVVPPGTPARELVNLAKKLMKMAAEMEGGEA